MRANINPESILITDDWMAYKSLSREFKDHKVINHSAGAYVDGETHTNTIEGFFGNMKTRMRGAYKEVSAKWLQSYLDEYAWRYNARLEPLGMFEQLLPFRIFGIPLIEPNASRSCRGLRKSEIGAMLSSLFPAALRGWRGFAYLGSLGDVVARCSLY